MMIQRDAWLESVGSLLRNDLPAYLLDSKSEINGGSERAERVQKLCDDLHLFLVHISSGEDEIELPLVIPWRQVREWLQEIYPTFFKKSRELPWLRAAREAGLFNGLFDLRLQAPPVRIKRNPALFVSEQQANLMPWFIQVRSLIIKASPVFKSQKSAFSEHSQLMCSAIARLIVTGDLLATNPVQHLASLRVSGLRKHGTLWMLENIETVRIQSTQKGRREEVNRQSLRLISPSSAAALRAIILHKKLRPFDYFFDESYFTDRRQPRKAGGQYVITRDINRWLKLMSARLAQDRNLPAKDVPVLKLRELVKLSRLLLTLNGFALSSSIASGRPESRDLNQDLLLKLLGINTGEKPELPGLRPSKELDTVEIDPFEQDLNFEDEEEVQDWDQETNQACENLDWDTEAVLKSLGKKPSKKAREEAAQKLFGLALAQPGYGQENPNQNLLANMRLPIAWSAQLLIDGRPTQITLARYRRVRNLCIYTAGLRPLVKLDSDALEEALSDILYSYKLNSRRKALKDFQEFFKWLPKTAIEIFSDIDSSPDLNWNNPDLAAPSMLDYGPLMLPREWETVMQRIKKEEESERMFLAASLGYLAGMRRHEVANVRKGHFIMGGEICLLIPKSKTRAGRRVMPLFALLDENTLDFIRRFADSLNAEDLLFPDAESLLNRVVKICREVTGRNLTFHHLRHSFATLLTLRLILAEDLITNEGRQYRRLFEVLKKSQGSFFGPKNMEQLYRGLHGMIDDRPNGEPMHKSPTDLTEYPLLKPIPLISSLMGHLMPWITVSTYIHSLNLLSACLKNIKDFELDYKDTYALLQLSAGPAAKRLQAAGVAERAKPRISQVLKAQASIMSGRGVK